MLLEELVPQDHLLRKIDAAVDFSLIHDLYKALYPPNTISIDRARRFRDNQMAKKIFNEMLQQCMVKGLMGEEILYTDSTHIKMIWTAESTKPKLW